MFYFDLELNEEFETDLEQSKFFGEISLPERFLSSGEFSPDEMFVCQINLSEVRLYFKDFLLPSVGRLLFFIDLKKKRPIVRYINEECEAYTSFNDDLDFDIDCGCCEGTVTERSSSYMTPLIKKSEKQAEQKTTFTRI